MSEIWLKLKAAGRDFDTGEMARLIVQILSAAAGSDAQICPLRKLVEQHETELSKLGEEIDTVPMAEIIGILCMAFFTLRHAGQPMAEFEELIQVLKTASYEVNTELMAKTFERLYHLCESKAPEATKQASIEKIEAARQRVYSVVRDSEWAAVSESLANLLWTLAEVRPDFEELPSWIAEAKSNGVFDTHTDGGAVVTEKAYTILHSAVNRYGDDSDGVMFSSLKAKFLRGRASVETAELAIFLADLAAHAVRLGKGDRRLPLAIDDDELIIGRHTRISFNRTLRVPEDGKKYPLPAGFGRLPILRVEDYANRVPENWLEQGGFIIPLYQREALFLEFKGVAWRPTIGKVSVGRINAITGKEHDLKIRPHRQDYIVIPEQHWLDGINSGNGLVSQFVAMPLGQGFTIEAQMTDEEEHGGFQITIFDPRAGRFPEQDPELVAAALVSRESRKLYIVQMELLKSLPEFTQKVIQAIQKEHPLGAAKQLGLSLDEVDRIVQNVRAHFEHVLGEGGFDGLLTGMKDSALRSRAPRDGSMLFASTGLSHKGESLLEMGIAAGGSIEQQILEDTHGVESWDEAAFRDITIHIVNSEVYQHITGREVPPCPITQEQYRNYKIPWYSDYKEKTPSVLPVAVFKRILSIGQIDKNRGSASKDAPQRQTVSPEEIIRIQTPTLKERFAALVERTKSSFQNKEYKIAVREASLALDLDPTGFVFFDERANLLLTRACSHLFLGNASDAEADASACLERRPDDMEALSIRAMASLNLGEYLLARNDAEKVLESVPTAEDAIYVRDQAVAELTRSAQAAPRQPIEQEVFPTEKVGDFVGLAQKFIADGVDTPAKLAAVLGEFGERTGRDLRHYSQALWDALGMVNPALRGTHDWNGIYAGADAGAKGGTAPEGDKEGNTNTNRARWAAVAFAERLERGAAHAASTKAAAQRYDEALPVERMPQIIALAQTLVSKGVRTPEALAADLRALGARAMSISQNLWRILHGFGAEGPLKPDWDAIFLRLEAKAGHAAKPPAPQI